MGLLVIAISSPFHHESGEREVFSLRDNNTIEVRL